MLNILQSLCGIICVYRVLPGGCTMRIQKSVYLSIFDYPFKPKIQMVWYYQWGVQYIQLQVGVGCDADIQLGVKQNTQYANEYEIILSMSDRQPDLLYICIVIFFSFQLYFFLIFLQLLPYYLIFRLLFQLIVLFKGKMMI